MTLQARFSIILGLIALLALVTFSRIIRADIEELQSTEIENQLSSHLTVSRAYMLDILENVQSDLDLISNDSLTRQYFSASESIRYQLFHSEITRTLNRYKKHSSLYSEIAIILPDGFKEIFVVDEENEDSMYEEEDAFLTKVLEDLDSNTELNRFIERDPQGESFLVAYFPVKRFSSLVTTEENPTEAFLKISINLKSILNQIQSNNIYVAFQHGAQTTNLDSAALDINDLENKANTTTRYSEIFPGFSLKATLDHSLIENQTEVLFRRSLVLIFVSIISLIFATVALLRLIIIRPIQQFSEVMQRSDVDDLAKEKWVAYEKNEFGNLKQKFDDLMHRVNQSSSQLRKQAFTDTLTGLPNRAALYELLNLQVKKEKASFSVLFLDLDGFKQVNDIYGHELGDELLKEVAKRLTHVVRGDMSDRSDFLDFRNDVVIRLGGDEFTIVLLDGGNTEVVADRILQAFQSGIEVNGKHLYTGTSIGIAEYPKDATDPSLLIQYADMAMYRAKQTGKMRFCKFSLQMADDELRRVRTEETVREGIEFNRFEAHFQAKIDARTNELVGVEALARLRDEEGNMVSPGLFIPIALESGVLEYITYMVTEQTCQLIQAMGQPNLIASINISPSQLNDLRLLADIRTIMWQNGVSPNQIEFEITEEELITNFNTTKNDLDLLRRFGFKTALDDFGSGYSSLGQLKKFQFDTLKLDRIFVATDDYDSDSAKGVIASIKSLADQLDMHVVAEGIETEEQLAFVQAFGIHTIQGYFFSRPIPHDEFIETYRSNPVLKRTLP